MIWSQIGTTALGRGKKPQIPGGLCQMPVAPHFTAHQPHLFCSHSCNQASIGFFQLDTCRNVSAPPQQARELYLLFPDWGFSDMKIWDTLRPVGLSDHIIQKCREMDALGTTFEQWGKPKIKKFHLYPSLPPTEEKSEAHSAVLLREPQQDQAPL